MMNVPSDQDCGPEPRRFMRILIIGNSGSGKSYRARNLRQAHGIEHLDLDSIVWVPGEIAIERPRSDVESDLAGFIDAHDRWVVEGCYGELARLALPAATELVFMNPGLEVCIANNHRRPFEAHKYASPEAQQSMLANLLEWVAGYYTRDDAWSYAEHRRLFDDYQGPKREVTQLGSASR